MALCHVSSTTEEISRNAGLTIRHSSPSLYQINTRVSLRAISDKIGRHATLDDIPDSDLDRLAQKGFDWVWFLGVWQTGAAGPKVSRDNPEWRKEFADTLPDLCTEDICGSCFAISAYTVASELGGEESLGRLRNKLHERGMRLLLDFVPNHTALDHPWVQQHPEFYVTGTEDKLSREPQNYVRLETTGGPLIFAFGRDPYFSGWPDTLQLNYGEPSLQEAMNLELLSVADKCDGLRCDMAMLVLPEVFARTWGVCAQPFWPKAIKSVRAQKPEFLFMAEVYWDLEWALQQQGFDYTYDKRLYDRLCHGHARPVRDHFRADIVFQQKSARFLENHDEPRAAATFTPEMHRAAAVLTYLCPGLRFLHDGQFEGRKKKISVHLGRRPQETDDPSLLDFYDQLVACMNRPEAKDGSWRLLECASAWEGNWTADCFVCFSWQGSDDKLLVVAVNYAPNRSQCFVRTPFECLRGRSLRLNDLMGHEVYDRVGNELLMQGLYLDLPEWGYNVFEVLIAD